MMFSVFERLVELDSQPVHYWLEEHKDEMEKAGARISAVELHPSGSWEVWLRCTISQRYVREKGASLELALDWTWKAFLALPQDSRHATAPSTMLSLEDLEL